jgi:predicted Ser/Thr protein kinase
MDKKIIINQESLNTSTHLTGYYNDNYIFSENNVYYVLRIPKIDAPIYDLKLHNEVDILNSVKHLNFSIPKVISSGIDYFVESFINGNNLSLLFGDMGFIDEWILEKLNFFFIQLHGSKIQIYPNLPWKNSSKDFYFHLVNYIKELYCNFWFENEPLYLSLGIKQKYIDHIFETYSIKNEREIVLCHCDIHRKNVLVHQNRVSVIDWELALFADPIYDLSIFLHKMRLLPRQEQKFIKKYHNIYNHNLTFEQFKSEIEAYRALEEIKTVMVDAKRILQDMKENKNDEVIMAAIKRYEFKLKKFFQRTKNNMVSVVEYNKFKLHFEKRKNHLI